MLELAGAFGLHTTAWQRLYDVCIVGGGRPAWPPRCTRRRRA